MSASTRSMEETICEELVIIGAGDVVAKRMLPAILASNITQKILVFHNGINEVESGSDPRVEVRACDATALTEFLRANRHPVIVATPPEPRMAIARLVRQAGVPVVLEKPLVANRTSLGEARALGRDHQLFALSYYVQEKAIAWTWLCTGTPVFGTRLVSSGGEDIAAMAAHVSRLGRLRRLAIRIQEGHAHVGPADREAWYAQTPNGLWLDLGVHALSLAMLGAMRETGRSDLRIAQAGTAMCPDQFRCAGHFAHAEFEARFGKNFSDSDTCRRLDARFDFGELSCDLDTASCTLVHDDGTYVEWRPVDAGRYRLLIAAVGDFLRDGGWRGPRSDLIELQCDALACLFDCAPESRRLRWGFGRC